MRFIYTFFLFFLCSCSNSYHHGRAYIISQSSNEELWQEECESSLMDPLDEETTHPSSQDGE